MARTRVGSTGAPGPVAEGLDNDGDDRFDAPSGTSAADTDEKSTLPCEGPELGLRAPLLAAWRRRPRSRLVPAELDERVN